MVRRGRSYDSGGRSDYASPEDMGDGGEGIGPSMRDIVAADAATARAAEALIPGSEQELNFLRVMSSIDADTPQPMLDAVASVLRSLPPDRAKELMAKANRPSLMDRPLDPSLSADADASADFVDSQPGSEELRKSWASREGDIKRDRVIAAQNARKREARAAAGAKSRAARIEAHPMDKPSTYGGSGWSEGIEAEQRSPGDRYLGRPFGDLKPYEQRQAMWLINPKLAQFVDQFQNQQLASLRLDPELTQLLTPEQRSSILGVAPDQITPDVMQAIYGMQLPKDVIDQMGYAQRDQMVGRPQLTPEQQSIVDRVQGDDFAAQVRATSPANRKIEKWMGMARSGDQNNVPFLDEDLPWWRASHGYFDPGSLQVQYSPNAPTGEFLARLARVTHNYDDPGFVSLVGPLFDRAVQQQAALPPMTQAARGRKRTAADFAGEVLTPSDRGLRYMRRYSGDNAPFQQFSDLLLNRGAREPLNIGSVELDATMQPTLPAGQADPMSMNTPEAATVEPPVMPPEGDLSMMFDPTGRGRVNPSILAALLA